MKLKADRRTLSDALQLAATVVPARTAIPTLTNVLLRGTKDALEVGATDLEVGLWLKVTDVEVSKEGKLALPAQRLAGIVRESGDEKVTIVADGNLAHIELADGKFKLVGLDPADFPGLPEFDEKRAIDIEAAELSDMIRKTEFAVSHESVMYAMTGILFELKGKELRLVATDGKRLALARRKAAGERGKGKDISAIVPPKAMKLLQRLLTEGDEVVRLNVEENQIRFKTARGVLSSRLLEGRFPDYEEVLPKDGARKATVEANALAAGLRRASLMAPEGARAVRLTFGPGKLDLFTRSADVGEANVALAAEYAGDSFSIVFNPDFVLDFLKSLDTGAVEVLMNEPSSACLFRSGKDYSYVLMPLQIPL